MVNKLSWLYEVVVKSCINDTPFIADEINIDGSWECGKTYALIESCLKSSVGKKVGIVFVRKRQYQLDELYHSALDMLKEFDIPYISESDRTGGRTLKIISSGNTIRFIYVERKQKDNKLLSGLRSFLNYKKVIVAVDEAYELTSNEKAALLGKIRGNGDTEVLIFQVCNPYFIGDDYIKYCSKELPYNKAKLMKYGYDMSTVEYTKRTRKIFAHINVLATKEIMNEKKWKRINEACARNRDKAMTIKYGIPSYDKESCYGRQVEKIGKPIIHPITSIVCGCDVGIGTNRNAGITGCILGFYKKGIGVDIFKEYSHDNRIEEKSITKRANELIDYVFNQLVEYRKRVGHFFPLPYVNINIDLSSGDFISRVNELINERRLNKIMGARRNRKNAYGLSERTNLTNDWIENRKLRIDFDCCPILFEEMNTMKLITSNNDMEPTKRQSSNDHLINAFEYAMEDIWEVEPMTRKV